MSASHDLEIDCICNAFEDAWKQGQAPAIEQYLDGVPEGARSDLLRELIHLDCAYQVRAQETLSPDAYLKRFPNLDPAWLNSCLAAHNPARDLEAKGGDAKDVQGLDSRAGDKCPGCDGPMRMGAVICISCGYDRRTRRKHAAVDAHAEELTDAERRIRKRRPRQLSAGFRMVRLGLSFHHARLLVTLLVGVVHVGLVCYGATGRVSPDDPAMVLGGWAALGGVAVAALLGVVGSGLCLCVGRASRAWWYIFVSLLLDALNLPLIVYLQIAALPPPLAWVFPFASWILFMLFLRQVAVRIDRPDEAYELVAIITRGIAILVAVPLFLILLSQLATLFGLGSIAAVGWLIVVVQLVLLIKLFFSMFNNIQFLRVAIASQLRQKKDDGEESRSSYALRARSDGDGGDKRRHSAVSKAEAATGDSAADASAGGSSTITYSQVGQTLPGEGTNQIASFTIADRYEIGEMIAHGGMGEVYAAVDRNLQRDVAIKLVRGDLVGTAAATRFLVEARILGQLQHPGIPPIHDVGVVPDGRPFLAMKLIKGRTLAALLAERPTPSEGLDHFLHVFEQICLAVAFAHAQGVIHRDLKPANVMVGSFGEVQVMDWGLAKSVRAVSDAASLAADGAALGFSAATQHGAVMGTLPYMPPEQARGEIDRLNARSDVFGLGAILCVILTGKPPYTDSKIDLLLKRVCEGAMTDALERVERSGAPVLVKQLAMRCLAPDPDHRPAHAGEVANAIRAIHRIVESSNRKSELHDATTAAEERQKAAWRTAKTSIAIGIMALAAAFVFTWAGNWWAGNWWAGYWWEDDPAEKSRAAAVREWAERPKRARQAFRSAIDELAKDVAAGTFRRGADAPGRAASIKRFESMLGDQEPKEQARGYLALAAAAAEIPEEAVVNYKWNRAAARYRSAMPSSTEVDLAIAAVGWDFPAPLKQTVLRQASAKLRSALTRKGLSDGMRVKVTESLAAAEWALSDK